MKIIDYALERWRRQTVCQKKRTRQHLELCECCNQGLAEYTKNIDKLIDFNGISKCPGVNLCLEVRELRTLYVYIYIFV